MKNSNTQPDNDEILYPSLWDITKVTILATTFFAVVFHTTMEFNVITILCFVLLTQIDDTEISSARCRKHNTKISAKA